MTRSRSKGKERSGGREEKRWGFGIAEMTGEALLAESILLLDFSLIESLNVSPAK